MVAPADATAAFDARLRMILGGGGAGAGDGSPTMDVLLWPRRKPALYNRSCAALTAGPAMRGDATGALRSLPDQLFALATTPTSVCRCCEAAVLAACRREPTTDALTAAAAPVVCPEPALALSAAPPLAADASPPFGDLSLRKIPDHFRPRCPGVAAFACCTRARPALYSRSCTEPAAP